MTVNNLEGEVEKLTIDEQSVFKTVKRVLDPVNLNSLLNSSNCVFEGSKNSLRIGEYIFWIFSCKSGLSSLAGLGLRYLPSADIFPI